MGFTAKSTEFFTVRYFTCLAEKNIALEIAHLISRCQNAFVVFVVLVVVDCVISDHGCSGCRARVMPSSSSVQAPSDGCLR